MIMKSVLITGCSAGGIDAALCHEFHKRGFHVFAGARTILKLGDVETLTHVTPITLDVTDPSSIMAAVEAVRQRTGGRLDCLINNAGAQYVSPFLDMNIEAARAMYDVNVWGCMDMVQRFAPLIIPAKGSIVNIASISGYLYALFMSKSIPRHGKDRLKHRSTRKLTEGLRHVQWLQSRSRHGQ